MTAVPSSWIEHRRASDRERVGWLREEGDGWVAVDLLGRDVTGVVSLDQAEGTLDELGLGYLAERYEIVLDEGRVEPVRIVEVTPDRIILKTEDWGAIDAPVERHELSWPAPPALRLRRP
ncbi:hypothetical protein [Gryllotalpicola protaetiae]|uniref:Uncharacterized protein n=1 Tax=Gryllotalpicola protaetiae TaxID=2419771 RepID=A0A387BSJ8_9MICO|nr:hypothetical protein [Gryllotalpicola protaetiae]AYG04039.1 hypothetical protein D7I44_11210 [Gryllotalpicola protaetiae]